MEGLGNFNIDIISQGSGNAELLNDLMSPETASTSPADITPIVKEVEVVEKKETIDEKKDLIKNNEDSNKNSSSLSDFLSGDNTEEGLEKSELSKKDISKDSKKENTENITDNQFVTLSKDLFRLGVFNKEENEEDVDITTGEDFLERFETEKKKGANEIVENFIGQFGEDYQNAFQAIFVKGADPKQYFSAYNEVVDYSEMDMTIEDNQKKVMKQALLNQEFEEEDIETEIDRLVNYGDLEAVATKHHKVLVKKGAAKLQEIQEQADIQLKQKTAIKSQYINNVKNVLQEKLKTKEFDGIPMNPTLANELQDFLLVDKWKTPSGETLTDFDRVILDLKKPENHAKKVKIGLLLKMLEKDPSLLTIQKAGVTKQTNQLFTEVARQRTNSGISKESSADNTNIWNL